MSMNKNMKKCIKYNGCGKFIFLIHFLKHFLLDGPYLTYLITLLEGRVVDLSDILYRKCGFVANGSNRH